MTNTEIIQAIRNEIERRIKECEATYPKDKGGYWFPEQEEAYAIAEEYKQLLSFLSTLESEKPMQEGLEEEIEAYFDSNFGTPWDGCHPIGVFELDSMARHFAQWQKEQDDRFVDIIYQQGIEKGKDDMEEQMLKEAVEAKIYGYDDGSFELIASWLDMPNNSIYKDGEKVRIIIVKEDEK